MSLPQASLRDMEFIAFDLETTGLHPSFARIVEVGAVRFRGDGTILEEFSELVNPGCRIPAKVIDIHGITDDMVAGKPGIGVVLPKFQEFVGEKPVIMMAHNAGFDVGFLSVAFQQMRREPPMFPIIDTCAMARRRIALPRYSLESIGRSLNLIEDEKHRALDDSLLLVNVFRHLLQHPYELPDTQTLFRFAPPICFESLGMHDESIPLEWRGLQDAIISGRSIIIEYDGGSNPGQRRSITPLNIVLTREVGYLHAYCHRSGSNRTFRLDRIMAWEEE
jgi:DNA polymerase III epsilon subunit family exonuclease